MPGQLPAWLAPPGCCWLFSELNDNRENHRKIQAHSHSHQITHTIYEFLQYFHISAYYYSMTTNHSHRRKNLPRRFRTNSALVLPLDLHAMDAMIPRLDINAKTINNWNCFPNIYHQTELSISSAMSMLTNLTNTAKFFLRIYLHVFWKSFLWLVILLRNHRKILLSMACWLLAFWFKLMTLIQVWVYTEMFLRDCMTHLRGNF